MATERIQRVSDIKEGQSLRLENRSELELTGVEDVISYSESGIELSTNMGMLRITGDRLKLLSVSTGNKTAQISGRIDAMEYKKHKEAKSFIKSIFK